MKYEDKPQEKSSDKKQDPHPGFILTSYNGLAYFEIVDDKYWLEFDQKSQQKSNTNVKKL